MDGNRETGCSPMEFLVLSLAGCMAVDVVHILGKMRSGITSLRAEIEGTRAPSDPRRYTRIVLRFQVAGEAVRPEDVERALSLSRDKYCSVYHSLRSDIEFQASFEIL